VVMVCKKDTPKKRFCIDYRTLNDRTIKNKYPLPNIDDLFDRLKGSRYFCVLDLSAAYWQVPMKLSDRQKTAFSTSSGHYHFNVMPFGLTNAPATQQESMRRALKGIGNVDVLLDDVILHGKTKFDCLRTLRNVLQRFEQRNFRLKPEKCMFLMKSIKYLGHVISENGKSVDPDKVKAVIEYPAPKNVAALRRFLGMASFCRKFVKNFSTIAGPLHKLTRKNVPFVWDSACKESFEKLKLLLMSPPTLAFPDPDVRYRLYTDASGIGVGATLAQFQNGQERIIAYGSKSFNETELKYSTIEKEAAAIVWAVKYFRPYLHGARYEIMSDHAPLKWMWRKTDATGRLGRWQAFIMGDEGLEGINYLKGKDNVIADALSRKDEILQVSNHVLYSADQEKDEDFDHSTMTKINGVWMYHGRVFVPCEWRKNVMLSFHTGVHFGIEKTTEMVSDRYYWPNMRTDIRNLIQKCIHCACSKPVIRSMPVSLPPSNRPFQRVVMDYAGPFSRSAKGNRYLLLMQDDFTRYLRVYPLREASTNSTLKCFQSLIAEEGLPDEILTDNGSHFTGRIFTDELKKLNISHIRTAPYSPSSNGMAERAVRTVKETLKAVSLESGRSKNWDEHSQKIAMFYNASRHSATGVSPFVLARGRTMKLPSEVPVTADVRQELINWKEVAEKSEDSKRRSCLERGGKEEEIWNMGQRVLLLKDGEWIEDEIVERVWKEGYKTMNNGIKHQKFLRRVA